MNLKLLGLLVIATVIKSEIHEKDDKFIDYFTPAKYTYSYGVEDFKTGDYKMHKEERYGDVVKGEYTVADPDGSIRTVTYTADKEHGFQAVVKKSEPLKVSTELKENKEISTQNKSSDYQHESSGSSVQDFHKEAFLKHTPISLHESTENGKSKDNSNEKEINQYLQYYQSYISKLQKNHQGNIKLNTNPHFDSMMSNNLETEEVEIVKDSSKKQNSNFQLNHKEFTTVNQKNTKGVTKVNQVTETLKNYQTISDNIPADLHGNYGQKLNVDQQSAISNQKVASKQTNQEINSWNQDYGNKDYQKLFYQPYGFNSQNQYVLKEVEIENPEFYENRKSQESPEVTQNMKHGYNQGEEKRAVLYQSVNYNNNEDEVSENMKKHRVQLFYVRPNKAEENVQTDKKELTKFEEQLHGKTLAEYYGNLQKQGEIEIIKTQKTQAQENIGEYLNGKTPFQYYGNHRTESGNKIIELQSFPSKDQLSHTKFAENDYKPQYFHQILVNPKFQFQKNVKV